MAIPSHPEGDRKSNGASWARNGKRTQNIDARAALLEKQWKELRQRQFADGRWWRYRSHPQSAHAHRPYVININALGKDYIVRRLDQYSAGWITITHPRKKYIRRSMMIIPSVRLYTVQISGQPVVMRFMTLMGVQRYFNELRQQALLPLDDPKRQQMLPMVIAQPKCEWKPSPWKDLLARLEEEMYFAPKPEPVRVQDLQSNEAVLEQIAEARTGVASTAVDDLAEAVQFAVEHPYNDDAQKLPYEFHLDRSKEGEVWLVHDTWKAFRRIVGFKLHPTDQTPTRYVGQRDDIAYLLKATRPMGGTPVETRTLPFPESAKSAAPDAALVFPLTLGQTLVHRANLKIARFRKHDGSGNADMNYGIWLESMGRTGKQKNNYSVKTKILPGDLVQIDTGGATKSHIPLAEWQAFVDKLDVEVSGVSITTIKQTPLLDKMCRDVIAGRRKAPSVKEWEAEIARPSVSEAPAVTESDEPAEVEIIWRAILRYIEDPTEKPDLPEHYFLTALRPPFVQLIYRTDDSGALHGENVACLDKNGKPQPLATGLTRAHLVRFVTLARSGEWLKETFEHTAPKPASAPAPTAPATKVEPEPAAPRQAQIHEFYDGMTMADIRHAIKSFEQKHGMKPSAITLPMEDDLFRARSNILDITLAHASTVHKGKIRLWAPAPDNASPLTSNTPTVLKHGGKTFNSRKDSCAHIVVTADFNGGRLQRLAGDPLCQPASKFPSLLDILPNGDPVCPECAELAERYDLPLPGNVSMVEMPSSRKLKAGDPQVRYKLDSKWFNYEHGFPFNGFLRSWKWLTERTVCQCGATVTDKRGDEPVRGMEIYLYRTCTNGHPIRDERDLRWPGPFVPKNGGPEGQVYDAGDVLKNFTDLQVTVIEDDVPF